MRGEEEMKPKKCLDGKKHIFVNTFGKKYKTCILCGQGSKLKRSNKTS